MKFTYEANSSGYMVFYNGHPLGGAGIIGKYKGRNAHQQASSHAGQAKLIISSLQNGNGPKHMLEKLAKYIDENKYPNETSNE